jgi:hypothetical protein
MDTKVFEDYQKQYTEWQKKYFDLWLENLPFNGNKALDFAGNFGKFIQVQEEVINTYLEAQQTTARMMLEAQQQFWNEYFNLLRKAQSASAASNN